MTISNKKRRKIIALIRLCLYINPPLDDNAGCCQRSNVCSTGMHVHLQQLPCAWNRLCFTAVCISHSSRRNHQTASVCRESALRKHNQIVLLHLKNGNMINIELNSGYKHTYQRVAFMWEYGGVPWHNIIQLYQLISLFYIYKTDI